MTRVAVVVLDSVRKDSFDKYFDWLPGIHYENAWSPSQYTAPVHAAMFTGKYASEVGVYAKHESLNYDQPVLAERLNEAGYTTRAFSANPILSNWNNFDRGFEEFYKSWRLRAMKPNIFDWNSKMKETSGNKYKRYLQTIYGCLRSDCDKLPSFKLGWTMKTRDDDGAKRAKDLIRNIDFSANEFLFMNLMEAHIPYTPPDNYRSVGSVSTENSTILGGLGDLDDLHRLYNNTVEYLADLYKGIFDQLIQKFDYVITLADHGEMFGEYGARAHAYGVFPQLTHVPLCISGTVDGTEHRNQTVSLIDIYQTILDIVGIDDTSRGRSLLGHPGDIYLSEYLGLRTDYIDFLKSKGFSDTEIEKYDSCLYGIASPIDYYGFQTLDGFENQGESELPNPKAELFECVDELETYEYEDSKDRKISDQIQRQLEDLGYA